MHSKTKIIVLHMKEIIYTSLFALLAILFVVLLIIMFSDQKNSTKETSTDAVIEKSYQPGIYTQTVSLNGSTLELEITLDSDHINSITLTNVSDVVATMYPLIQPVLNDLATQICQTQSLSDLSISEEHRYTSNILVGAIAETLQKAQKTIQ